MELISSLLNNVSVLELVMFIGGIAFFASKLEGSNQTNKQLIESEIKHVVAIMELNHNNIRDDIGRLEKKQEESNKIKERLAMQEILTKDIQTMLANHLAEEHNQK